MAPEVSSQVEGTDAIEYSSLIDCYMRECHPKGVFLVFHNYGTRRFRDFLTKELGFSSRSVVARYTSAELVAIKYDSLAEAESILDGYSEAETGVLIELYIDGVFHRSNVKESVGG